jgi:hypothetical protein
MKRMLILMTLAVCGLSTACGEADDTSRVPSGQATLPPERHLAIGESETHGDVTVTFVEASFSSSQSQLVFDIEDHSPLGGESSRPFLILSPASDPVTDRGGSYAGFATEVYPKVRTQAIGPHAARNTVTLGAVEAPDKPVALRIDVVSVEYYDGGRDAKGPWEFEFVPGQAAVDPVDFDVPVGKSACGDGICIAVDRVHFSTSNVEVHYQLETEKQGFRGAPGYRVRMIFPDGTWAAGTESSDPTQLTGSQVAAFSPLPENTRSFKLAFGPYLADLPGPFEITIPVGGKLPATIGQAPQEVALNYTRTVASENFLVRSLAVDQEGFDLTLDNVNAGLRSVVQNAFGPIEVSDDQGNTYRPATLGWAMAEDALGSAEGQGWAIRFHGQLDPEAQVLRLTMDRMGKLLYGPWEFDITVPEGGQ